MSSNISDINDNKYSQEGAFDYLDDKWHQVRISKSLEIISTYKNKLGNSLKALDIGCGDGKISEKIKDLGIEVYGLDVSEQALKKAEMRGIKTQVGDVHEQFPYPDSFFDIIFAGEVIEHIADPRKFVTEANRILRAGGLFVITTPNLAGLESRVKMLFGKIPRCIEPLSSHHYQHVRPFTFSSLKEFLERGGFSVNSLSSNRIKTGSADFYTLADWFPSLGSTIIVEAVKKDRVTDIELNKR